jgi:CubicO group peptidase (beta-lactamase class C family)
MAESPLARAVGAVMNLPEDCGVTDGLMVVQHGKVLVEEYGAEKSASSKLLSWSVAKSVTHALCGIAVRDGLLDIDAPAPVAQWRGDERRRITTRHLLAMSSGLAFREDYVDGESSDVIEMLFGAGQSDMAEFAASFPLVAEPGALNSYSSGTTNIVCGILSRLLEKRADDFVAWTRRELWEPLGVGDVEMRMDGSGTFIGSSFVFMALRDWARFGELYLAGTVGDNADMSASRILPPGWVDYARAAVPSPPGDSQPYGAHWWLWPQYPGAFAAQGYEGQHVIVLPHLNAVVCRFGRTPDANKLVVRSRLAALITELA